MAKAVSSPMNLRLALSVCVCAHSIYVYRWEEDCEEGRGFRVVECLKYVTALCVPLWRYLGHNLIYWGIRAMTHSRVKPNVPAKVRYLTECRQSHRNRRGVGLSLPFLGFGLAQPQAYLRLPF
jgi:hypothetical protein